MTPWWKIVQREGITPRGFHPGLEEARLRRQHLGRGLQGAPAALHRWSDQESQTNNQASISAQRWRRITDHKQATQATTSSTNSSKTPSAEKRYMRTSLSQQKSSVTKFIARTNSKDQISASKIPQHYISQTAWNLTVIQNTCHHQLNWKPRQPFHHRSTQTQRVSSASTKTPFNTRTRSWATSTVEPWISETHSTTKRSSKRTSKRLM